MNKANKATLSALITAALAFGLTGCDGDDGQDGAPGSTGLHIDMAQEAIATITNASYSSGIITVDFDLENKEGVGLFGLTGENEFHDFRFSLAQLQLAEDSELKQWFSLLNETTNDAGTTFEQGFEKIKDCVECLVDHNNGSYTYTFKTDLNAAADPAGVVFDPMLTQRIAIEMQFEYDSGHELAENAHYDWIPETNSTEGIETRDLVTMETCYTCHQPDSLRAHGGRRLDMENCQSCHNGIVTDPNAVSVELGHMIHAIHMGPHREGQDADGNVVPMPYTVSGYHGPHAFDYPMFPTKPFMDCTSCHVDDENLADKDLWLADANSNSCVGCHTESPANHFPVNETQQCTDCHSSNGHIDHTVNLNPYEAAEAYSVTVSNVMVNADNLLEFDVQILDADGVAVTDKEIYQKGYSNPYMVVSWDVEKDYPAQTVTLEGADFTEGTTYDHRRFSLKGDGSTTYADGVFHVVTEKVKGGKTYTLDLPDDIGTRSLEILSIVKVCFEEGTGTRTTCDAENAYPAYVQSDAYRTILDTPEVEVAARRSIVDDASCFSCHSKEFYHDSNGVNCISCHTNDKKLKGNGTHDGTDTGIPLMKSTSFMYKAHKAEGHDNGHGGSGTLLKTDCMTCHSATEGWSGLNYGFELGRNAGQAHTMPSTQTPSTGETVETWYASPDAAACMSCHQKYLSDSAMTHIEGNGGYFGADKAMAEAAKEACATCHTPAKLMESHGHSL